MLTLDLIPLILMLATFILLLVLLKLPSGLSLMASSVVGLIAGVIIHAKDGLTFDVRFLIEGGFGYIDNLLVIVCAMVFIKFLQMSGGLDYLTAFLIKVFHKFPTVLLMLFMALLLLPGMVTGSSTAAVVSAGIIIAPIMVNMGMPKAKVAAFIGFGAILGMVAPPINIPVMVICDVVDIPYNGFDETLLLLTVPMALFSTVFFSRDIKSAGKSEKKTNKLENIILSALFGVFALFFLVKFIISSGAERAIATGAYKMGDAVKYDLFVFIFITIISAISCLWVWLFEPHSHEIDMESIKESVNFDIFKELKWYCLVPLFVIVLLFLLQSIFPKQVGVLATPLLFIIASIPALFTGKKFSAIKALDEAVEKCLGVLGLLMGVGMFIEVLSVTGARALIVANILKLLTLSKEALYVAMALSLSVFGGISSFASASVFGGPFVMALYGKFGYIIVASVSSLIAALGEFLPPTAMSSRLASKNLNDLEASKDGSATLGFMETTKACAIPLALTLIWGMLFVIALAPLTA